MSGCACIYVDVDEPTDTISCKKYFARKEHTCSECGVIFKRQQYERYAGKWEGKFFEHKTCLDCLSLREEFFCSGWIWGKLLQKVEEYVCDVSGDIPSKCINRLTPGARNRVLTMIEACWSEEEG